VTPAPRQYGAPLLVLLTLALVPLVGSEFFVTFVLTRTLMLGMAAATIVFLSGFGGMTSMAQLLMFGISGFMIGNFSVSEAGSKGLKLGIDPWLSVVLALLITTAVALLLGAISSRTTGIYYLMLTFIFAVIGFLFFGQVTTFSGFGGITGIAYLRCAESGHQTPVRPRPAGHPRRAGTHGGPRVERCTAPHAGVHHGGVHRRGLRYNYLRSIPLIDRIGITEARFNTVIGLLVLLIVIVSPDGITGLFDRWRRRFGSQKSRVNARELAVGGSTRYTSISGGDEP